MAFILIQDRMLQWIKFARCFKLVKFILWKKLFAGGNFSRPSSMERGPIEKKKNYAEFILKFQRSVLNHLDIVPSYLPFEDKSHAVLYVYFSVRCPQFLISNTCNFYLTISLTNLWKYGDIYLRDIKMKHGNYFYLSEICKRFTEFMLMLMIACVDFQCGSEGRIANMLPMI